MRRFPKSALAYLTLKINVWIFLWGFHGPRSQWGGRKEREGGKRRGRKFKTKKQIGLLWEILVKELKPPTVLCCSFAVDPPPLYFCLLLVIFPIKVKSSKIKKKKTTKNSGIFFLRISLYLSLQLRIHFKFIFRALLIFLLLAFPFRADGRNCLGER